jgi:hypothetical protein
MINCIFQEFTELNSIGFVGYTPSFNDGDPQEVINFIDRNFDLSGKTGGYII